MKTPMAYPLVVTIGLLASLLLATISPAFAGNDFVQVDLRVDQRSVAYALAFQTVIWASAVTQPAGASDYTSAWLSIDLANQPGVGGAKFSQVGLMTRPGGLRWFVYAEPGVTCYRGTPTYDGKGCEGVPGDLVSVAHWYRVELRRAPGGWQAIIYDTNSHPYALALIEEHTTNIFAATVTSEQGYSGPVNPYTRMDYFYSHPVHYVNPGGRYVDWPNSANGIRPDQQPPRFSQLRSLDSGGHNWFCPLHYGATVNYLGDPRVWFAGTGGRTCSALMFPPEVFLPTAFKQ